MLFCSLRVLYQWIADSRFLFPWYEYEPDPDLTQTRLFAGLVCMRLWILYPSLAEKVFLLSKVFFPNMAVITHPW